jgi:hypothetical protein
VSSIPDSFSARSESRSPFGGGRYRYQLAEHGLHHAMLLSHVHTRLPGLAQLTDPDPPAPSLLRTAARNYQRP